MGKEEILYQQTPTMMNFYSPIKSFLSRHLSVEVKPADAKETPIKISAVRESFISKYDANVQTFHTKDVERIENDDKFVQRFIDGALFNDQDASVQDVIDLAFSVLSWRLEYGINDMTPADFPADIFKCGLLKQTILPNGDIMICIVGRRYKRVSEIMEKAIIPGILWYYEYGIVPYLNLGSKLHILFDATKCGLDQADTVLIFAGVPILTKYYPGIVSKCYVYGLPWILKPFISLFKPVIPKKFADIGYMVNDKNKADILGSDCIPDILGGNLETTNLNTCENMADLDSCGMRQRIKEHNAQKFKKVISDAYNIK